MSSHRAAGGISSPSRAEHCRVREVAVTKTISSDGTEPE